MQTGDGQHVDGSAGQKGMSLLIFQLLPMTQEHGVGDRSLRTIDKFV